MSGTSRQTRKYGVKHDEHGLAMVVDENGYLPETFIIKLKDLGSSNETKKEGMKQ